MYSTYVYIDSAQLTCDLNQLLILDPFSVDSVFEDGVIKSLNRFKLHHPRPLDKNRSPFLSRIKQKVFRGRDGASLTHHDGKISSDLRMSMTAFRAASIQ